MNTRKAMILVIASAFVFVLGSGVMWGETYDAQKTENGANPGLPIEILDQQYHQFGNNALHRHFMERTNFLVEMQKLSQVRPIAPYNSWFDAGMNVMGNGIGILPFYSRRISNRSFYQIRVGFTTLWHPYMNYRNPTAYGYGDYGTTFLVPMLFSYKRYWGENHPGKRVYPYFATGAGPVLGMMLPASGSPYNPAYSKFAMRFGPAAFAGLGLNIVMTRRYWLSLEGRYEVQYFPTGLGPRYNYSSPAFFVGISRGFYF